MAETTKTSKKKQTDVDDGEVVRGTWNNFKNALLIVSLLLNLFFLTGWIIVQVTTDYDTQILSLFLR